MKKKLICVLIAVMALSFAGCGTEFVDADVVYEDPDDGSENDEKDIDEPEEDDTDEVADVTDGDEVTDGDDTGDEVEEDTGADSCPFAGAPTLSFTTTDMSGNEVSFDNYKGSTLIMVNMWEPWCGPCVGEMPDIEKLYQTFKGMGFVVLGVTSETNDSDINSVISSTGVTYPILRDAKGFESFRTDYVPTTVFFDGHGHLLTEEPYVGSMSYEDWAAEIKTLIAQ